MSNTNKIMGNSFESDLCERLFEKGYWVHNMAQNVFGQPADIIAVKDGNAYLIDCKVCSNNKFPLSRVESNQHQAMKLWGECGNGQGWFALRIHEDVLMIPYSVVEYYLNKQSGLNENEIYNSGLPFEIWATYNHPIESVTESETKS